MEHALRPKHCVQPAALSPVSSPSGDAGELQLMEAVNADGRIVLQYSTPSAYIAAKHAENITFSVKSDDFFRTSTPHRKSALACWTCVHSPSSSRAHSGCSALQSGVPAQRTTTTPRRS